MYLKTKSGRLVALPTEAEELEINAGIAADSDTVELDARFFARARPASDVLNELFSPEIVAEMLTPKKGGRPPVANPKIATNIRLDSEVIDSFKATGKGWQTRINDVLKEWLREHPDLKPV